MDSNNQTQQFVNRPTAQQTSAAVEKTTPSKERFRVQFGAEAGEPE